MSAKNNPSAKLKENLEVDEYLLLLDAPCTNQEVKAAFIFSCYTDPRWVDVSKLEWKDIKNGILTTRIIQAKTGKPVTLTLHEIAKDILEKQKQKAAVPHHCTAPSPAPRAGKDAGGRHDQKRPASPQAGAGNGMTGRE